MKCNRMSRHRLAATALGFAIIACAGPATAAPDAATAATKLVTTSPETANAGKVRAMFERGYGRGDLTVADETIAARYVEHEYLAKTDGTGPEIVKASITETRKAFADLAVTVEDLVERGDTVWTRTRSQGIEKHSGKPFSAYVFDIFRFEDGKIVEHWGVADRFAVMHQVGLMPPPPAH